MKNNEWQCKDGEKYISNIEYVKKNIYQNIIFEFIFFIKSKSELLL